MQDKLLANRPQYYECTHCNTILTEESVGVRQQDYEGNKILYCPVCQNEAIKLIT